MDERSAGPVAYVGGLAMLLLAAGVVLAAATCVLTVLGSAARVEALVGVEALVAGGILLVTAMLADEAETPPK